MQFAPYCCLVSARILGKENVIVNISLIDYGQSKLIFFIIDAN